jgi:putative transposase
VTCRVLKMVRQDYYRWLAAPITASELEEAYLANALFDAHRDDPEFGYRFLADEIKDAGFSACERTIWKVCSTNGWWSSFGKKKTRKKAEVHTPAHDDLVRRRFSAGALDQLWLGDITAHQTTWIPGQGGEALPLCHQRRPFEPDRGLFDRRADEGPARCRRHQQRSGSPRRRRRLHFPHRQRITNFRSRKVHRTLTRHNMVGSMGQAGSAGDNAAMESFFALLQKNALNTKRWDTREELRIALVTWIERTYHRRRRQVSLGRLTPLEYEAIMTPLITEAA